VPVRLPLRVGVLLVLLLALAPAAAHAQATRTWVSGGGNDANPCSRAAPCQTYSAAASATATDGEISAIDSGGFGALSIVKGLTLDGSGVHASVLGNGAASAIIVNAPGAAVILRDLSINGVGPAADACGAGSVNGIRILAARSVRIEDVDISRFKGAAVLVAPSVGATSVSVENVSIADMCTGRGVDVSPTGTGTAKVLVSNSNLSHLPIGVFAGTGGHAFLSGSTIFDATTGIATDGTGEIDDDGGNVYSGNETDGTPTRKTLLPTGPAGPAGATGPAGPAGPAGVAGPAGPRGTAVTASPTTCTVPKLTGLKLKAAQVKVKAAGCAAPKVVKRRGSAANRGKVVKQSRTAATKIARTTRVTLTVGS
jgi:hypothetical protein